MPSFGKKSIKNLVTCHPRLQELAHEVIKHFDCSVLCGYRNAAEQHTAYVLRNSTKQWPNSEHNKLPSIAIDIVPYPIDWDDIARFRYFSGFVMGIATQMGIKLRSGGDWDMDTEVDDQTLIDLPHFEYLGELDEIS